MVVAATIPRMPHRSLAMPAMVAFVLGGCASAGTSKPAPASMDATPVARSIVLCTTTLADLRRQLGEPTRDGILHRERIVSWITAWDPLVRYLAVVVDAKGIVVDLYWDVPTEATWSPTNQCMS